MKKSLVFGLVFILIAAVTGFSEDYAFVADGNAWVSWGFDLDYMAGGFNNGAGANLNVTLVADHPMEVGTDADGAAYGYIKLTGVKLVLKNDGFDNTAPVVDNAKVFLKPVYIAIYAAPDLKVSKASCISAIDPSLIDFAGVPIVSRDLVSWDDGTFGIEVGVNTDFIDVALQAATNKNYVDGLLGVGLNNHNDYAVALAATIKPFTGFKIEPKAGMTLNYLLQNYIAMGIGVSYEAALSADMSLIPSAGFDYKMDTTASTSQWDAGVGVRLKWKGTDDAEKDLKIFGDKRKVYSGLSAGFNLAGDSATSDLYGNLVVSAYEDSGDDGLLPMVGFAALLEIANLIAPTGVDMDLGAAVIVDVTISGIKPYVGLYSVHPQDAATAELEMVVGAEIQLFAHTALTVEWKSDDLTKGKGYNTVGTPLEGGTQGGQLGDIVLTLKVSF